MKQISIAAAEYAGKRKKSLREAFLDEMERVVPWKALLKVIEPFYPVAGAAGLRDVINADHNQRSKAVVMPAAARKRDARTPPVREFRPGAPFSGAGRAGS